MEKFHMMEIDKVFSSLNTGRKGLTSEKVKNNIEKYGKNTLEAEKRASIVMMILHQFMDPLIYILLVASLVTFIIHEYVDMWVILTIIMINAVVGFVQEIQAEKAMNAIKNLAAPKATVVRDGDEKHINADELVPGDIVHLMDGNKVPADIRLFETRELKIDEAILTGESLSVLKKTEKNDSDSVIADRINTAYMGTVITGGRGRGVVIATSKETEVGKISEQVKNTEKEKTPLQKNLERFSGYVAVVSLVLALAVFIIGYLKGKGVSEMILFSISMAVSIIPEGLPIVITITMAIGLKRMADRNAIVRKLVAVETLGSCDYICSDKTGTITENKMTLTRFFTDEKEFVFEGEGYIPEGRILLNEKEISSDDDLKGALTCAAVCNNADLYHDDDEWKIEGDPTEAALLVAARKFGINYNDAQDEYTLLDEVPFSSERKFMAVFCKRGDKGYIFVKGAPEKVLEFCGDGNSNRYDKYKDIAAQGLRGLAFAVKTIDKTQKGSVELENESKSEMKFLGFCGIIDPPRKSVIKALEDTRKSGIRTIMITGDNEITATAIAKQIKLITGNEESISGAELDAKGDDFIKETAGKYSVYARVAPEHKLKIVAALQEQGHIVAVTGDGVNDAPALKKGNIGVSMGKIGTDVAREASDMILKDDNFATIFEAVKVGRVIFENIKKVTYFLLSSGVGEAITIIVGLLLGMPLPFLATQILWVNLVTNGLQDVALAYEPGEAGIEKRKPRDPKENIMDKAMVGRLLLVGIIMAIGTLGMMQFKLSQGFSVEYARTVSLNTIVFFQFFHVLNCRSFDKSVFIIPLTKNPFLLISMFAAVIAQVLVVSLPGLQFVFKTVQLDAVTWVQTIMTGASIIVVMEVEKIVRKIISRKQKVVSSV